MPSRSPLPLIVLLVLVPPSAAGKAECPPEGSTAARAGIDEAGSRARAGSPPVLLPAGDEPCGARSPVAARATLANTSQRWQPEASEVAIAADPAAERPPDRQVASAGSRDPPGEPLFIQHRALLI